MKTTRFLFVPTVMGLLLAVGCTASKVDLSVIQRPSRPAELDAYNAFVGSWTWEAEMVVPDADNSAWSGTAEWSWTLDNRCLVGKMISKSDHAEFEAEGVWSWHPKSRKYIWWMFNNWGYPQEGTAKYCAKSKSWRMPYKSVGLDGSTSYGRYGLTVVDDNTIDWDVEEWADPLHMFKKLELKGTYRRK
jgi:hypothetical protein